MSAVSTGESVLMLTHKIALATLGAGLHLTLHGIVVNDFDVLVLSHSSSPPAVFLLMMCAASTVFLISTDG